MFNVSILYTNVLNGKTRLNIIHIIHTMKVFAKNIFYVNIIVLHRETIEIQ